MEKIYRALGMVDKDGNVFDETKMREQVMSALGVSKPAIETAPVPKPPFRKYEDCCEACLALPSPDAPDFGQLPEPVRTLAVAIMLEVETSGGGLVQYLWNCGGAYAVLTPESLRALGLPEHAGVFERWLASRQLDAEAIDRLHPQALDDEAAEAAFEDLCAAMPTDDFEAGADWSVLQETILRYANAHPEAFVPDAQA